MTRFRFKLKGGYVIGAMTFPTEVGNVTVGSWGDSIRQALSRAATVAQRISEDPVMSAMLPPQATMAIKAAKALSAAAREGKGPLREMMRQVKGEGAKRLAAALHKEVSGFDAKARAGVRHPNRGAWQHWAEDDYDDEDDVTYADEGDDVATPAVGLFRRGRRRGERKYTGKRRNRREREDRDDEDDERDVRADEPTEQPAEPTEQPADNGNQDATAGDW